MSLVLEGPHSFPAVCTAASQPRSRPQLPLSALSKHGKSSSRKTPSGITQKGLSTAQGQRQRLSSPLEGVEGNPSSKCPPQAHNQPVSTRPPSSVQVPTLRCHKGEAPPLCERPPWSSSPQLSTGSPQRRGKRLGSTPLTQRETLDQLLHSQASPGGKIQ